MFLLVVATIVDGELAALRIGVSGFWFGDGPESAHAGALAVAGALLVLIMTAPY